MMSPGQILTLLEQAGIPPLYRDATLSNFTVPNRENPTPRRELANVLLAVKNFIRDFPQERRPGLLLSGAPGTGKTHLAIAALRGIIEKGYAGEFREYQTLLSSLSSNFDDSLGFADIYRWPSLCNIEALLLDDFGSHVIGNGLLNAVEALVAFRCNHERALIVTTNLPLVSGLTLGSDPLRDKELPDYRITLEERVGARAFSRLHEMCIMVRMPIVDDYRVHKLARQF